MKRYQDALRFRRRAQNSWNFQERFRGRIALIDRDGRIGSPANSIVRVHKRLSCPSSPHNETFAPHAVQEEFPRSPAAAPYFNPRDEPEVAWRRNRYEKTSGLESVDASPRHRPIRAAVRKGSLVIEHRGEVVGSLSFNRKLSMGRQESKGSVRLPLIRLQKAITVGHTRVQAECKGLRRFRGTERPEEGNIRKGKPLVLSGAVGGIMGALRYPWPFAAQNRADDTAATTTIYKECLGRIPGDS